MHIDLQPCWFHFRYYFRLKQGTTPPGFVNDATTADNRDCPITMTTTNVGVSPLNLYAYALSDRMGTGGGGGLFEATVQCCIGDCPTPAPGGGGGGDDDDNDTCFCVVRFYRSTLRREHSL